MAKIRKKIKHVMAVFVRQFLFPLAVQIVVVHITVGIVLSKSLMGKTLLLSESAMIALSIVVCQIFQTQNFHFKRRRDTSIRLVRTEVVQ